MRFICAICLIVALFGSVAPQTKRRSTSKKSTSKPAPTFDTKRLDTIGQEYSSVDVLFNETEYQDRKGWREATQSAPDTHNVRTYVYYDLARMTHPASHVVRAWLRYVNADDGGNTTGSGMDLEEYNCSDAQSRTLQSVKYDNTGTLSRSVQAARIVRWAYLVPDSLGERVFAIFCHGEPDADESQMRLAARWYAIGVDSEKYIANHPAYADLKWWLKSALDSYQYALEYAADNQKVLAAIERVTQELAALP